MKKSAIPLLFIIGIYVLCIFSALFEESEISTPWDYARITAVDYKAELVDEPNSKGKVVVTERLTFDIHAASKDNLFWELWRDLPESYVDGVKVYYKVNSVKEIGRKGKEIVYDESKRLYWYDYDYTSGPRKWYHSDGPYDEEARNYECVFFYVDGLYREEVTFEIEYEMYNAALRYKDCSELYLCFYSEDTINYLESFKAEILIPEDDMPSKGNYEAHTYGTNSNEFPFKESKTRNPGYYTFYFSLDEEDLKFRPYNEYIEFALVAFGEDKHKFTDYASRNAYYNDNVLDEIRDEQEKYEELPGKYKNYKMVIFFGCVGGAAIVLFSAFRKDKKLRKQFNFYEPTEKPIFYRDIPSDLDPHFAASLVFCKHKVKKDESNGYSAIMLSLIRKDYIELAKINPQKDWTSNNVRIIVKYQPKPIIHSLSSIAKETPVEPINSNPISSTEPVQSPISTVTSDGPIQTEELNQPVSEYIQPIVSSPTSSIDEAKVEVSNVLEEETESVKLEPLTPSESYYFDLIIRHSHGKEIPMKSFQSKVSIDYENTDAFVKKLERSVTNIGVNEGYFQKASYDYPKQSIKTQANSWALLGILIIIIVNFVSYQLPLDLAFGGYFILGGAFLIGSIYLKKIANKYVLLTQFGEDEYAKWRALYNFLNSETLIKERTVVELPLWEKYLVYATAFGISDKVIAALKIRCPEMQSSPMLSNSYYQSKSFYHSSGRSFRTAARTATSTARGGGYGGHGGYGGGGRGGGGGGGGH